MIVVMKPNAKDEHINNITDRLKEAGLGIHKSVGVDYFIFANKNCSFKGSDK